MSSTRPKRRPDGGFSLTEIIIVLAILGLATGAVVSTIATSGQAAQARASVRALARALVATQRQAIATNKTTTLELDVESGGFVGVESGRVDANEIAAMAARAGADKPEPLAGRALFRFFPDGSSSGGRIAVRGDAGSFLVEIDWLTGRVWVEQRQDGEALDAITG